MLPFAGGFERRLASGGRAGHAAPNDNQAVGDAVMDLEDATAGIFDNLIVTLCSHTEALILGISSLLRGGPGWRKLPCLHMPLHVHPLLPVGSTRTVWTRGSPIHANESVVATGGGTVEPLLECTKGTKGTISDGVVRCDL